MNYLVASFVLLVGVAVGVPLGQWEALSWKSELDPLALAALLVNLALVWVVHTVVRRHHTRETYALDGLRAEVGYILERSEKLHGQVSNSHLDSMTKQACQEWLQGHREVANRIGFLKSETVAWGMPRAAIQNCANVQTAWTQYKEVATEHGFPPRREHRFSLPREKQTLADSRHVGFKKTMGAYRRSIVA